MVHLNVCLIDLANVNINEGECVIFTARNLSNLKQAHLGALTEAFQDLRHWNNIIIFVSKSTIFTISPTIDDLVVTTCRRPGKSVTGAARNVSDVRSFQSLYQGWALHPLLHRRHLVRG